MRPSSLTSDAGLYDGIFARGAGAAAVSGASWLRAMLDVEAALAAAQARAGLIPAAAATAIAATAIAAEAEAVYDIGVLAAAAAAAGSPVIPLVRMLREWAGDAAPYVHKGATTQDVQDTAAMLVARRSLAPTLADLAAIAEACVVLAERHRDTLMAGRTLLQQALPITFGLKAAGWLTAVDASRTRLADLRDTRLAVQFGGAAGTLGALGADGIAVIPQLARELDLAEPILPWHTDRTRIAELAGGLGAVAGTLAKIATDVKLLAQTEVAEVAEPSAPGRGGSSALPHKRNPVGAVAALACAQRVPALVATLLSTMAQEHERAAGAWHAEWETLSDLLRLTGSAAGWLREVLEGLRVDAAAMRANLDLTGGLLMAERVTTLLVERTGDAGVRDTVTAVCTRAAQQRRPLREMLLDEPALAEVLTPGDLDVALDPAGYLGSAHEFIDRALAAHWEAL